MRIGLVSPIVTRVPRAHSPWEAAAGAAELAQIARAADDLGYEHLTCSEHVAVPTEAAALRGGTYWDPLSTFGFLAGQTSRIGFLTQVLVLGYHHPLEIVKRYGTLDTISGGRVSLGLGVGSLREEFALLGAPFDDRGARADEAIAAIRAAWGRDVAQFDGEFYSYDSMVVDPAPTRQRVPIWIGGRTRRSLRRAIALGDGWVPFGLTTAQVAELLGAGELPPGFDVALSTPPLDPEADPRGTANTVAELTAAGATVINASLRASSVDHYCDQLVRLAELAGIERVG